MNIEITEIFMAKEGKNGWDNCFHGTIKRSTDENGNPIVYGKIKVNDQIIQASAKDQWESEYNRYCDGFVYILDNTTTEERKEWKINAKELQREIKKDEKYIYQVAKEHGEFKIMSMCFSNYAIIRKHIFGIDDE